MNTGRQPLVSAILVSWNVRDALERAIQALLQSSGVPFEIIVVDNASTDGTAAMLRTQKNVTVLINDRNIGFATAVNRGVQHASGRYIVLVNSDVEVFPDTLLRAAEILKEDEQIGVLGGKLLNMDGTIQQSVHRLPKFADQALTLAKFGTPLRRMRIIARYRAYDFRYTDAADVEQVEGALFAFPRAAFDAIAGFDGEYFLWFEEVDFCRRIATTGRRVRYDPRFSAKHYGGLSAGQLSPIRRHLLYQRSLLRYFRKFHSPQHLLLFPFAAVGTLLACLASLLPRNVFRRLIRPSYATK